MQVMGDRPRQGSEQGKGMEAFLPLLRRVSHSPHSSPHSLHPRGTRTCSAGVFNSWPQGAPGVELGEKMPGRTPGASADELKPKSSPEGKGWPIGQPGSRTAIIIRPCLQVLTSARVLAPLGLELAVSQ